LGIIEAICVPELFFAGFNEISGEERELIIVSYEGLLERQDRLGVRTTSLLLLCILGVITGFEFDVSSVATATKKNIQKPITKTPISLPFSLSGREVERGRVGFCFDTGEEIGIALLATVRAGNVALSRINTT